MARNWFGRISVDFFDISLVFAKVVRQSCRRAGYEIDDIYGDACKVVSDFSGSNGSSELNHVRNKGTNFASCAFTCEGSWLVVKLKCAPN